MDFLLPANAVRTFVIPLDEKACGSLEDLSFAGPYGNTPHKVAQHIIFEWARESEPYFAYHYGLNINDAIRLGYGVAQHKKEEKVNVPPNHVAVSLNGLSRYLVERLEFTELIDNSRNTYQLPNEFYQKRPEVTIARLVNAYIPRLIETAQSQGLFDDDEEGESTH